MADIRNSKLEIRNSEKTPLRHIGADFRFSVPSIGNRQAGIADSRLTVDDCRYSKLETGNSKLGKDAAATHWSRISIFEFRFSAPSIGNRQAGIADSRLTVDDCRCSKVETANSKLGKDAAATHWSRVSIFCSSNRQSLRFCLLLTAYCLLPTAYWLAAAARFDGGDAGLAERTFGRIVVLNG
jgi:hypothetical protein